MIEEVFLGPKKKTIVGLLVFKPLCLAVLADGGGGVGREPVTTTANNCDVLSYHGNSTDKGRKRVNVFLCHNESF
jgi:hypothetical protein